jgi:hypothetical protein
MNSLASLIFVSTLVFQHPSVAGDRTYQNLGNPTQYTFHAPKVRVLELFKNSKRRLAPPPEPLHGAYIEREDYVFSFGTFDQYTSRYWTGKREKDEDISPPEAGRIGTIEADFNVKVASISPNETLVTVVVESFQQQVGRRYQLFPHMQKVGRMVSVKSDTYYEYLFLLRLGELLGETGMPPIKGSAD